MRFLLIALLALSIYANADEMERIESIVNDINRLRANYEKSQDDLSIAQFQLMDEKQKNTILLNELKIAENKSKKLENQINILEKKYNKLKALQNDKKEKSDNHLKNQINDKNKFPKLLMKEGVVSTQTIETPAHTYRLNKDAIIYDAKNGNIFQEWENRTSFTSNQKSDSWIKITGYFVDKIWQKATQELWIKEEDANQRE